MKSLVTGVGMGWAVVLGLMAVAGCAQVHSGRYGTPVDPGNRPTGRRVTDAGLKVSADELTRWSTPQHGMIEVTFENEGPEWVELREMHVAVPPEQVPGTSILSGQRIAEFREAVRRNAEIEQQNLAIALGILTLGGLVVGETTEGAPKAIGAMGAATGAGGLIAMDASASADRASHIEPYPSTHLLGGPFSVGPGLHTKRWIILETKPGVNQACVDRLRLKYRVSSGREELVWLSFRDATSPWQRELCGRHY